MILHLLPLLTALAPVTATAADTTPPDAVSTITVLCDGQPAADGLIVGAGGPSGWPTEAGSVTIPNSAAHAAGGTNIDWAVHDLQTGTDTPLTYDPAADALVGVGCRQQPVGGTVTVTVDCSGRPAGRHTLVGVPHPMGSQTDGWAAGPWPVRDAGEVDLPAELVDRLNDPAAAIAVWLVDGSGAHLTLTWLDGRLVAADCPLEWTDTMPTTGATTTVTAAAAAVTVTGTALLTLARRRRQPATR